MVCPDIAKPGSAVAGRVRRCLVCDAEIRSFPPGLNEVCESAHCRVLMTRRANVSPDGFRFLIAVRLRQQRELRERVETERLRLAERSAREAIEHESIRDAACREEHLPASSYPLLVLPSGPHELEPLTRERRQQYREHLDAIIAEAGADAGDGAATAQDPSTAAGPAVPLAAQLCALCRGGCCSIGGDKAYLTAATIRRFTKQRPELLPDEIAEAYLDRLVDQTVVGSCINHTGTGCSLPRDMRSDTCNNYYCDSMRAWQTRCTSGEHPLGAFVIQRREDNWNRRRSDVANDVVGISVVSETAIRSLEISGSPPVEGLETRSS